MSDRNQMIRFYKVSGAGNHFVLLDVRDKWPRMPRGTLVRGFCAHGHSVGADGVLFIAKSRTAHFKLLYYNSNGREAELCGNGTRCAALYAYGQGFAPAVMNIESGAGIVTAAVKRAGVELGMGRPHSLMRGVSLKTTFGPVTGDFVNTGVPHFVVVPRNWRGLDVEGLGREIRHNRAFRPKGSNVNFARRVSKDTLEVRTYERGVEAETLACGTGAVAVAVCLAQRGVVRSPVKLRTRGGDVLRVRFKQPSNPLSEALLYGPAQVVYEGCVPAATVRAAAARPARFSK